MSQYVTEEGVPLRGDGTPFPEDPGQWSAEEREYLENYAFRVDSEFELEGEEVALADVPEVSDEGGGVYA